MRECAELTDEPRIGEDTRALNNTHVRLYYARARESFGVLCDCEIINL